MHCFSENMKRVIKFYYDLYNLATSTHNSLKSNSILLIEQTITWQSDNEIVITAHCSHSLQLSQSNWTKEYRSRISPLSFRMITSKILFICGQTSAIALDLLVYISMEFNSRRIQIDKCHSFKKCHYSFKSKGFFFHKRSQNISKYLTSKFPS